MGMSAAIWVVIAAGLLAVAYAVLQTRSLLAASAGDQKMQEVAAAIQEGANAYLRRQYTTIAGVGFIILLVVFGLLGGWVALGYLIGATLSGLAGFAGMLVSVAPTCAPPRPPARACRRASPSLSARGP
jgi:K(+)-stimulated pyrophosphate-energized sodium pump